MTSKMAIQSIMPFALLMGLSSCVAVAKDSYFPPATVSAMKQVHGSTIMIDAYAETLRKIDAPSVFAACTKHGDDTYRMLYRPSLDGPSIAITAVDHRRANLNVIVNREMVDHDSGKNRSTEVRSMSAAMWNSLTHAIGDVNFFDLPTALKGGTLDGTSLFFEACRGGNYHAVERQIPSHIVDSNDKLVVLGEMFLQLGSVNIKLRPIVIE